MRVAQDHCSRSSHTKVDWSIASDVHTMKRCDCHLQKSLRDKRLESLDPQENASRPEKPLRCLLQLRNERSVSRQSKVEEKALGEFRGEQTTSESCDPTTVDLWSTLEFASKKLSLEEREVGAGNRWNDVVHV